uniref:Uncharacterized protein n=1 Tax=Brassica oleracea var. oleracea TaxID=109376 RepID=A0A0D3ABY5_BRAOL
MAAARLSIDLDYEQARLLGGAQSAFALGPSCMESYLVSKDLWDVVGGNNTTPPRGNAATPEATKEWTRKNAKAEFALKRSIS